MVTSCHLIGPAVARSLIFGRSGQYQRSGIENKTITDVRIEGATLQLDDYYYQIVKGLWLAKHAVMNDHNYHNMYIIRLHIHNIPVVALTS